MNQKFPYILHISEKAKRVRFQVSAGKGWISWVLRRRRRLTSSPSLIHSVEQNPVASTGWG